jgi:DNA-binding response OmpR family regulator
MANENILVVENNATLLRVVESVLSRAEFKVASAPDPIASLAMARSSTPALILIDSLMGEIVEAAGESESVSVREIGVRLCRELGADAALSKIPVVLMVPKGEDVESRYARTPNVVDYITKPFSPDTLLTVVEQAISGRTTTDVAAAPPAEAWPLERAADAQAEDTAAATEPRGEADLAGDLQTFPLADVMSLLARQHQTGILTILGNAARLEIDLRDGCIDFASATGIGGDFLLGRFIAEASDLLPAVLDEALAELQIADGDFIELFPARARRSRPPGHPQRRILGRTLLERGAITAAELSLALRRQAIELACEALRWSEGRFRFHRRAELRPLAAEAALQLPVDAVLLEGLRRVDEWRVIERGIRNFDVVFVRDERRIGDLPLGTLTRDEILVLDALNGRHSVRDVIRGLRMGSFDVTRMLHALRELGLVRPRVEPVATPAR